MTLTVPDHFATRLTEALGEPARRWCAGAPALAEEYLSRWSLRRDGELRYGFTALVLPVRQADGTPAALKLMCPNDEGRHEALALSLWDGAGAVRLLAEDGPWVLLLERLDDTRTLAGEPIDEAVALMAGFLRRLDRPAPPPVRTLRALAARWARELPEQARGLVPARYVDAAVTYCVELGPRAGDRLVNQDLHFENVLAGTREPWLVIDPKPIAADREFVMFSLLYNRFDDGVEKRLEQVCRLAGLDVGLARRWTLVNAVDSWVEGGEFPTPELCAAVAELVAE